MVAEDLLELVCTHTVRQLSDYALTRRVCVLPGINSIIVVIPERFKLSLNVSLQRSSILMTLKLHACQRR